MQIPDQPYVSGHAANYLARLGSAIVRHGPVSMNVLVSSADGVPELSAVATGALVATLHRDFVASVEDVSMMQWLQAQPDGCELREAGSRRRWEKVPLERRDPPGSVRIRQRGANGAFHIFSKKGVDPKFRPVAGAFGLAAKKPWLDGGGVPEIITLTSANTEGASVSCCALLLAVPATKRTSIEIGRIIFEGPNFREQYGLGQWLALYDPAKPDSFYRSVMLNESVGIREIMQPLSGRIDTSPRIAITCVRDVEDIRKLTRRRLREGLQPWLSHCAILPANVNAPDAIQSLLSDQRSWAVQCQPAVIDAMQHRLKAVLDHAGSAPSGIKVLAA